jgi:hypothetical protein
MPAQNTSSGEFKRDEPPNMLWEFKRGEAPLFNILPLSFEGEGD